MFKINNKNVFLLYLLLTLEYFTPFSSVSPAGLEQVNACWAPPHQFINAEI